MPKKTRDGLVLTTENIISVIMEAKEAIEKATHTCLVCKEQIPRGEEMMWCSQKYGIFYSHRECVDLDKPKP